MCVSFTNYGWLREQQDEYKLEKRKRGDRKRKGESKRWFHGVGGDGSATPRGLGWGFPNLKGDLLRLGTASVAYCQSRPGTIFQLLKYFRIIFSRSKTHRKSDLSHNHPKSKESNAWAPRGCFRINVGWLLTSLLWAFSHIRSKSKNLVAGTSFRPEPQLFRIDVWFTKFFCWWHRPKPHLFSWYVDLLQKSKV